MVDSPQGINASGEHQAGKNIANLGFRKYIDRRKCRLSNSCIDDVKAVRMSRRRQGLSGYV